MNIFQKIRRNFYNIRKLERIMEKPISVYFEERNYLYYTIEKDSEFYSVFRIKKSFQAIGFRPIYSGTYRECKKYCRDHKIELERRIYE